MGIQYDEGVKWRKTKATESVNETHGRRGLKNLFGNASGNGDDCNSVGDLTDGLMRKKEMEVDRKEVDNVVRDSPSFRSQQAVWDSDLFNVLNHSKKMIKSANTFLCRSEEAVTAGQNLTTDICEFAKFLDPKTTTGYLPAVEDFRVLMNEMLILRTVLDEQLRSVFVDPLKKKFKDDPTRLRRYKNHYEIARTRYANALNRYLNHAQNMSVDEKNKQEEELKGLKESMSTIGYDMYLEIKRFRTERHLILLEHLFYFVKLNTSFFRLGHDEISLNRMKTMQLKQLSEDVATMRDASNQLAEGVKEAYAEIKASVTEGVAEEDMMTTLASEGTSLKKEGWLYKLSNSATALQRWKRKWFILSNGRLFYRSNISGESKGNVDMLLTTIRIPTTSNSAKSHHSRAFTFEIICANPRVEWAIQAESDQDKNEWIHALQTMTANLLGVQMTAPTKHSDESADNGSQRKSVNMGAGMSLKDNAAFDGGVCVECSSRAEWASINLGVLLCLECSGAHRSLGVHISKVRSLAMDAWTPQLLTFMKASGNTMNRRIWEAKYSQENDGARPEGPGKVEEKKAWVFAKYKDRKWLAPLHHETEEEEDTKEEAAAELYKAVGNRNLEYALHILAVFSGDAAYLLNCCHDHDYGRTALHLAVANNNIEMTELLLQAGTDTNIQDSHGETPLHLAAKLDHEDGSQQSAPMMEFLISRKANPNIVDALGRTAVQVASLRGHDITHRLSLSVPRDSHDDGDGEKSTAAEEDEDHGDAEIIRRSTYLHRVQVNRSASVESENALPPDWSMEVDPASKQPYYFNVRTSESSWTKPVMVTIPPPPPALPPRMASAPPRSSIFEKSNLL